MSATELVTESGAAPDLAARFATAMSEAERILTRARSRVRRAEDVTLVREAFSCLAEAEQCVQEGAVDTATWRHIGEAVLLADQVGRSPLL